MKKVLNTNEKVMIIYSLIILYLSGSVMSAIATDNLIYRFILIIGLLMSFGFTINNFKNKISKKTIFFYLLIICSIFIQFLISGSNVSLFVSRIIWLILFIQSLHFLKKNNIDFFHYLYIGIVIIATYSIFFFVSINVLKISLPYKYMNSGDYLKYKNYFYIFFECPSMYSTNVWGHTFTRLQGLFWEPGAFQIFINFALYRLLFYESGKHKMTIYFLFLICIVLSLSTTGLLLFSFLTIYRAYCSKQISTKIRILLFLPFIILIIFLILNVLSIKRASFAGNVSFNLRINDIKTGYQIFLEHPIFGTGFDNNSEFIKYQKLNRGSSNGLVTMFYTLGVFGTLLIAYPYIYNSCLYKKKDDKAGRIAFLICLIISTAAEPILTLPIFWLLLANEVNEMIEYKRNKIEDVQIIKI